MQPDDRSPASTAATPSTLARGDHAVRVGGIPLATPVVLAPMAGVTNAAFRRLCRGYGGGMYVSEMVAARALVEGYEKANVKASFADDEPVRSLQLYATDAWAARHAAPIVIADHGVDHIDLNFGCPVGKVTRHGGGAALPWRIELFRDIVEATIEGADGVPVTVKLRKGIDDDHLTYLDAADVAIDAGAAAITLHGRTAADAYAGHADWSAIRTLVEHVDGRLPVFGNGDIWTSDDALRMIDETGCDGVTIGRGCLGRPWLFRDLEAALAGRPVPAPPDIDEVVDMMVRHATMLAEHVPEQKAMREFRKHTGWYLQGFRVGGELRAALHRVERVSEVVDLLGRLERPQPFPTDGMQMRRGHSHGPQQVKLPHGWLNSRGRVELDERASAAVSGG